MNISPPSYEEWCKILDNPNIQAKKRGSPSFVQGRVIVREAPRVEFPNYVLSVALKRAISNIFRVHVNHVSEYPAIIQYLKEESTSKDKT